ncbi:MAG: hypothetical protein HWN79_02945 [Candidatus Lokiarchaeota archaeon]|nr:hypothetical protein [Candidatus Lokiarchaeota archaeon]
MKKTKEEYYSQIQKLAEENGILLISSQYQNNTSLLTFKCKSNSCGKIWQDSRANIIRRKFKFSCPKCSDRINRSYNIDDLNELAAQKPGGGRYLSKQFQGTKIKHLWECFTCGHKWWASPNDIRGKPSRIQGSWCPKCNRSLPEEICRLFFENIFNTKFPKENKLEWLRKTSMHLDGYNDKLRIAFEYQGKHHYEQIQFFHSEKKEFQESKKRDEYKRKMCKKNGITLIEIGYKHSNGKLKKISFDEMCDEILRECRKFNVHIPKFKKEINWREFKISSDICIDELKDIARSKGGECLSNYWLGSKEYYEFKCSEGHIFKASYNKIKGIPTRPEGSWCPKCKYKTLPQNQLKYTKTFLDQLALKRGGEGSRSLSPKYLGFHKKHIWQCSKGHIFNARFDSIKGYPSKPNGTWCKICSIERRTE